jgi:hypothetical protein
MKAATGSDNRPSQIVNQEVDLESGLPRLRQLLTVRETAEYLRCNLDHVYRLLDQGDLTGENHALKVEGETLKGRPRPRYIRIHRQSAIGGASNNEREEAIHNFYQRRRLV